jgi:hypothetical protein
MTDLSLVSMDDMVAEIKSRFDIVVIITCKHRDRESDLVNYNFQDKIGCLGLVRIADKYLKEQYTDKNTGTFNE